MPDIATRLRQTRANMIGTDDEQHYWDCHEAASHIELLEAAHKASGSALAVIDSGFQNAVAEIQRLRLTDAEREAIREAVGAYNDNDDDEDCAKIAATLHGLLKRTDVR
jgi:predicted ATP-dependent serine protease